MKFGLPFGGILNEIRIWCISQDWYWRWHRRTRLLTAWWRGDLRDYRDYARVNLDLTLDMIERAIEDVYLDQEINVSDRRRLWMATQCRLRGGLEGNTTSLHMANRYGKH